MREKSKLIAFMLSIIPGLSHLYIGYKERALIFFTMFAGVFLGCTGMALVTRSEVFVVLFVVAYPIIWLIALVDMFSAWKKKEMAEIYNSDVVDEVSEKKFDKKSITMALSIIPGAGHMYLGYQKKGLYIMGAFFFSIFFMGWLGISLLLFLLPLIWFYGFFDAMHIVDGSKIEAESQELNLPKIKPEWVGFGLIGIGVVIILERILYPLIINWQIRRYIQTSVVSLIFIGLGIYILKKYKKENIAEDNDISKQEDISSDIEEDEVIEK